MKKVLSLVLAMLVLVFAIGSAYAEGTIGARYTHTSSIVASLSINGGSAKASGKITPENSEATSILVRLQKETNPGEWTTIATWSGTKASGRSEAGGSKSVTSGYNYRVYVTGKVYDSSGNVIETVDKYSSTRSY